MDDIKDLDLDQLKDVLKKWQEPEFRAGQIFSWIYQKGVAGFEQMSNLPLDLRKRLQDKFYVLGFQTAEKLRSQDGSEKLLFALKDGNLVESVSIPIKDRVTACLSAQVGCKFSCRFCASGISGFKRDLSCGEIIEQAWHLKDSSTDKRLTHIVFMGTGEPLDNYDNVLKATRIINAKYSFNIAARHITISTSGIIPQIERLSAEGLQIELSISLHAADDKLRSNLMPINKKYPLPKLMQAVGSYIKKTNRQVTFEYILIKGVNSSLANAKKLAILLRGLNCKVNLIICNYIKELRIEPPDRSEILLFKDRLLKSAIPVTLRKSRGQDIAAACGQLRLRYAQK